MKKYNIEYKTSIVFLKSNVNYTFIFYDDGKSTVVCCTLKKLEIDYFNDFLRISKHYLVNPIFVSSFRRVGKKRLAYLTTGETLVVSRRKWEIYKKYSLQ